MRCLEGHIFYISCGPEGTKKAHSRGVTCGAYSPDGTRIVSGSDDETLRLWNISSGLPNWPMTGHDNCFSSVAFSPDGSCIASAFGNPTIPLWNGRSGEALGEPLTGHKEGVWSLCVLPGWLSHRVWRERWHSALVGCADEKQCWRASAWAHIWRHFCCILSGRDMRLFFFARQNHSLLGRRSQSSIGHHLVGHASDIRSLAISRDGKRIVSGSQDSSICVWDARSPTISQTMDGFGPPTAVSSCAFPLSIKRQCAKFISTAPRRMGVRDRFEYSGTSFVMEPSWTSIYNG